MASAPEPRRAAPAPQPARAPAPAPVVQAAAPAAAPPLVYTVVPGDTLFGVARRFGADPRALAGLNGLTLETKVRSGQRITLPEGTRDQSLAVVAAADTPKAPAPLAATPAAVTTLLPPSPTPTPVVAPLPPPSESVEPPASETDIARAGRGRFTWPVKGEVLSAFGPKGVGQRNDGVNIASSAGQRVAASAGGEVIFAGELPGDMGKLVLLKHDGGWVTAYAHLSRIDVKMRDRVTQGQGIGLVGQTGVVDQPQLHFEIRYAATTREKARPVDPAMLLPGAG